MLLELGHQTEHTHDLGDPGASDPLPPGYLGLVCAVYASPLIQTLAVSIPPPRPPSRATTAVSDSIRDAGRCSGGAGVLDVFSSRGGPR